MKQNNIQLELFTETKGPGQNNSLVSKSIFGYIRGYEKIILVIIGVGLISIIAFCLGVEKGKNFELPKGPVKIETGFIQAGARPISKPFVRSDTEQVSYRRPPAEKAKKLSLAQKPQAAQGYTIQLASYKSKQFAQKELTALRKTGLVPFVISKGNYTILCVGNFSNMKDAKATLTRVQNKYKGSFIRRL